MNRHRHLMLLIVLLLLMLTPIHPSAAQDSEPNDVTADPTSPTQFPDDPLGFLAAAREAGPARPAKIVRTAIESANLCATVDFSHISVDAKRGIFDHEKERPHLLYAGDRLRPADVDLREAGVEVQIDFITPRSKVDLPSAYLFLPAPLRRHRGEVYGLESVAEALAYIAASCAENGSSEGSPE